jgi:hypothetical protein
MELTKHGGGYYNGQVKIVSSSSTLYELKNVNQQTITSWSSSPSSYKMGIPEFFESSGLKHAAPGSFDDNFKLYTDFADGESISTNEYSGSTTLVVNSGGNYGGGGYGGGYNGSSIAYGGNGSSGVAVIREYFYH